MIIIISKPEEEIVDLCQCSAYAFGRFIQVICIEQCKNYPEKLKDLSHDLLEKKINIEEALKTLKNIQQNQDENRIKEEYSQQEMILESFVKTLWLETEKDIFWPFSRPNSFLYLLILKIS